MTNNIDELLNKSYVEHGEFKVPEGYFESLQQRIMDRIPDENATAKKKPLIIRMSAKAKYAAAACLTGLIVVGGAFTFNAHNHNTTVATAPAAPRQEVTTDSYAQQCMDYAMVDDADVYNYLADQD